LIVLIVFYNSLKMICILTNNQKQNAAIISQTLKLPEQ